MSNVNPVVHFEMSAEDRNRMKEFYAKAFGWQMQQLGPDMGDYVLVSTTETDENGRPPNPGVINGGFYKKPADQQSHSTSLVIGVADIRVSMKKISESGGKL